MTKILPRRQVGIRMPLCVRIERGSAQFGATGTDREWWPITDHPYCVNLNSNYERYS